MSELRKVDVGNIDLDIMQETAQIMGLSTVKRQTVRGQTCELVVKNSEGSMYDLGFRKTKGKVEVCYDNWQGKAKTLLKRIMPRYKEQLILKRAHVAGMRVIGRKETENKIIMRLARA